MAALAGLRELAGLNGAPTEYDLAALRGLHEFCRRKPVDDPNDCPSAVWALRICGRGNLRHA